MRWIKVAAFALGVLIVFSVIGTVVHLVMELVFAAIVVGAIAVAIKVAAGRRKLPRGRNEHKEREIRQPRPMSTPAVVPPSAAPKVNVDDDLARLKREMGS
jgi:hypothetical protein